MLGVPKTRQQIANEYDISRRTFYTWLRREEIVLEGRLITPKEQELIYQTFGIPKYISKKERIYYENLFQKS